MITKLSLRDHLGIIENINDKRIVVTEKVDDNEAKQTKMMES